MEVELKLLIEGADVAAFRRHALIAQHATDKPRQQRLTNIYFDTPDLQLKAHGLSLRVRRAGGRWIQTLKADGSVAAGLHQRDEWESRLGGPRPELALLAGTAGADAAKLLRDSTLAARLAPIFGTRYRRTVWPLRLPHGDVVELALDEGELQCGPRIEPISEVELELKSGAPDAPIDFALQLLHGVPMRLGNVSKSDRGYALHADQPSSATKAKPVELDPRMNVEQAFQAIVGNCLAQIQHNESGVVQGSDLEAVHQMRVGLRRLRSALRLFGPMVPLAETLQSELDWLGSELGAARDWEVLAAGTLARLATACPGEPELVRLQQAATQQAVQRRQAAAAAVASQRYVRLLLNIAAWCTGARWRASLDAAASEALVAPVNAWAAEALARVHAKLRKRGKRLQRATPEQRHRLRIAAKKVRYATEFFQALCAPRRVKSYLKVLAEVQDSLGWLNDAAVADALLRELAHEHGAPAHAAGFARGWLAGHIETDLQKLQKLWKRFASTRPPWAQ